MIKVRLTAKDMEMAERFGLERHNRARKDNLFDPSSQRGVVRRVDALGDVDGVCGEMAVAKALHCKWEPRLNSFHGADLMNNIQVRHTRYPNGRLIVRPEDPSEHFYVLVIGVPPELSVIGGMKGEAAKQYPMKQLGGKGVGCHAVPQDKLRRLKNDPEPKSCDF